MIKLSLTVAPYTVSLSVIGTGLGYFVDVSKNGKTIGHKMIVLQEEASKYANEIIEKDMASV